MTSISTGTNGRKKGTVAEIFDESLTAELFNLIWGQERSTIPTVVDYAYEEIWKHVIMIGGAEEQRLSDVTLSEQLGISRTPVRQALERLVQGYFHPLWIVGILHLKHGMLAAQHRKAMDQASIVRCTRDEHVETQVYLEET